MSHNRLFLTILGLGSIGLWGCSEEPNVEQDQQVQAQNPQENAGRILAHLQDSVSKDLPSAVNASEAVVSELKHSVLQDWKVAWLSTDADAFAELVLDNANISGWVASLGTPLRTVDGVSEYKSTESGNIGEFLSAFSSVEHVAIDIHEANVSDSKASLKLFVDVRGVSNEILRQDRGWMTVEFQNVDQVWKIAGIQLTAQETLTAEQTTFSDVTEKSGLASIPLFPRLEALRRGGYAITVGDYDNDNDADIYVGGWGASNLYANNGDGTFTDVTAQSKIGSIDRVKAAAMADLDNDGDKELILSRFIDDKSEDLLVYNNEGEGQFALIDGAITKALQYDRAMPLTVADFNNDGFNDIYVGFPGARDFTYLDANPNPLNTQGLFVNNGEMKFSDETLASGLDVLPGERVGLAAYPHASVKADFDGDGHVDLMVADDRRGTSQVFRNLGDGSFAEAATQSGLDNKGWAMGVAVGDFDNDGLPDVYYSNIDFLAAKRVDAALNDNDVQVFHGNRLYRNLGDGTFEDVTEKSGVGWAGEAAAGAGWFDYDNDGDLDLYVLNGLWTGPGDQELSSLFNRAYAAELLIEKTDIARAKAPLDVDAISLRNPGFNNMIIQTLTHFSGDLDDPLAVSQADVPSLSLGGNQRNVLFRNNGDGTFTELGYLAGIDTIDDGYMPAFADVNQDGRLDLLVRSCDPGTSQYQYPSLRLYQNQHASNNSLRVTLAGDGIASNRDAVGAKVTVRIGEQIMVREIDTVIGAAQSDMSAFFGLAGADKVDELTIHWPSGKTDIHRNVAPGAVSFSEGATEGVIDSGL